MWCYISALLHPHSWATIPLMYLLVRGFRDVSTGYMVMFLLNLLIGITTCAVVFLLRMFLDSEVLYVLVSVPLCTSTVVVGCTICYLFFSYLSS